MTMSHAPRSTARSRASARALPMRATRAAPGCVGLLIAIAVLFLAVFVVLPLVVVFAQAFSQGIGAYLAALSRPRSAGGDPADAAGRGDFGRPQSGFGLVAAWAIAKFEFRGKSLLITLIDLPFSVSPVISGLVFVLLFGAQGYFGPWLQATTSRSFRGARHRARDDVRDVSVRRARTDPADAGAGHAGGGGGDSLGASGLQTFFRVTLPNIKWGVLYGVLLCNARAMGEFGAVSVVSGHIRGETNTMPLHVEILYNEYQFVAAFAVASLLACWRWSRWW